MRVCWISLLFVSNCFFTNTTISLPFNLFFCERKLSLIMRFIRFLSTALDTFFFGTASPSRAIFVLFFIAKNKKKLSLDRFLDEKTAANSSGFLSLLKNRKCSTREGINIDTIISGRKTPPSFFASCFYYLSARAALHASTKPVVSFAF